MKNRCGIILRVKFSVIILMIATIGYLKPPCLIAFPNLNKIFNIVRIISLAIVGYMIISKNIAISRTTKILCFFEIYFVFITIIRLGNVSQALISAVTVIGEILLFELGIKWKLKTFLKILCNILQFYVVINFISIFVAPNGILQTEMKTPMYFLGMHNRFVFWMLPLISFMGVRSYLLKNKITWNVYFIYILCLLSLLLKGAAGALIGLIMFAPFFLIIERKYLSCADYKLYIIVYLLLWITLTFFDTLDMWSWLTYGVFRKSGSLTARLSLWTRGKQYLTEDIKYLLFGYGLELDNTIRDKFWYVHLHNNLLNVIYQCGILGMLLYLLAFISVIKKVSQYKHNKICQILTFSLFSFLIMLLMDTYDLYGHFYTLLVLAMNLDYIVAVGHNIPREGN